MNFNSATVKAVKADFPKGEITLTFVVPFDNDEAETARELAQYCSEDAGTVVLSILARQMAMRMERSQAPASENGDKDPLFLEAVELAQRSDGITVSLIQRNLRVGYARAARLVDDLARLGVVSVEVDAAGKHAMIDREDTNALD